MFFSFIFIEISFVGLFLLYRFSFVFSALRTSQLQKYQENDDKKDVRGWCLFTPTARIGVSYLRHAPLLSVSIHTKDVGR